MLKGTGKIMNRPTKTGGKLYDKFFIYIPSDVSKDSAFPFEDGEKVSIRLKNGKLVVEKESD